VRLLVLACATLGWAAVGWAVDSDPLPVPKGGPREQAVIAYNAGVKLMLERRYAEAQARFEAALALDETMADAHNILAFSLRMQGSGNFARSYRHYNRALELDPKLARAYMYRGVLFVQMGDFAAARAEHAKLLTMDVEMAAKLLEAIEKAGDKNPYDGIAPQRD
jgi:tetratricopeptide (TPR) repeat protein